MILPTLYIYLLWLYQTELGNLGRPPDKFFHAELVFVYNKVCNLRVEVGGNVVCNPRKMKIFLSDR